MQANKNQMNLALNKNRVMIQCVSGVNKDAVSRTSINGVEHIIVESFTLPDDIVMNGGLYPAAEIEKSFASLERTLAPVEHPEDANGNFISATDPESIHNFHAGAFNMNVTRENGRVRVEKHINVQEAMKSDKGLRLLDRINELETSTDPRPIHTSTGIFLVPVEFETPQTNAAGDEFTWAASEMVFDHDAILLDSVGAAQPHQGVGMAVNAKGEECGVQRFELKTSTVTAATTLALASTSTVWDGPAADKRVRDSIGAEDAPNAIYGTYHLWFDGDDADNFGAYKLPFVDIIDGERKAIPAALRNAAARLDQTDGPTENEKTRIRNIIEGYLEQLRANSHGLSFSERFNAVQDALTRASIQFQWIEELFESEVIFSAEEGLFSVPYRLDEETDRVTIVGIPFSVERNVTFTPKVNQKGDAMKEAIVNALKKAGVEVEGLDDDQLLAQYNTLQANQSTGDDLSNSDDKANLADVVADALKPVTEKLASVEAKLNEKDDAEMNSLAKVVVDSGLYPGLDEESAKGLPVVNLKEMAANCQPSYGLPGATFNSQQSHAVKTVMPE